MNYGDLQDEYRKRIRAIISDNWFTLTKEGRVESIKELEIYFELLDKMQDIDRGML